MKALLYLVVGLLVAVGAAFYLHQILFSSNDPGHVLIGYGNSTMETSLYFAVIVLIVTFIVFYLALKIAFYFIRLPKRMGQKKHLSSSELSRDDLVSGLVDSAEGNWEQAEKTLIRHAADSGTPLMHYLTAAKAAQSRGAFEKRDEYLQSAHESTPGSELTVGLTEVELQLSDNQFDKALDGLTALQSLAPGHASVLRLLHQTYRHLGDWQAIHKLLPDLQKNKALMEAEIKLLQTETYSELLKESASTKNVAAIQNIWAEIPKHIKNAPGMSAIYYAAMIEAGAGIEVESQVRKDLDKNWNETLVVLYGCIESKNAAKQLTAAESWLGEHPDDAILLRMLGKLCSRGEKMDQAKQYLTRSVELEPSVDAYLHLGNLLAEQGDTDQSKDCYKQGLLFASNEMVSPIEEMQVVPDNPREATA